jgi:subtilisin family serine protease
VRATLAVICACLLATTGAAAGAARRPQPAAPQYVLLELARSSNGALAGLRRAQAVQIAAEPPIWRLPRAAAATLVPSLERAGVVRRVAADRLLGPLQAEEGDGAAASGWWLDALRVRGLAPPGPGKPVTVVDTGLDIGHPEFQGRPDTVALNRQEISSQDDFHGTAISSLIGAQGKRVLGIYPKARLFEWDASNSQGLSLSEIIGGIVAATREGPGVINLSFGSDGDVPMLEDVILEAFRKGSIVVAASGDSRGLDLSPYPAEYAHVLTVAATDRHGEVGTFSSPSSFIDVAAPGVGVTVAVPQSRDPSGYMVASGTSYSAALVSGALAWIWTARPRLDNTQLITLVRRTAKRLDPRGISNDTGWGELDLRAALSAPVPPRDPFEPNDDVRLVRPGAAFAAGTPLLTTAGKRTARLAARLDQNKDPADVYRAFVPAHGTLHVAVAPQSGNVIVRVWGPRTPTILERGGSEQRDLLATHKLGGRETFDVQNPGATGEVVYVDVSAGVSRTASYTLSLAAGRAR